MSVMLHVLEIVCVFQKSKTATQLSILFVQVIRDFNAIVITPSVLGSTAVQKYRNTVTRYFLAPLSVTLILFKKVPFLEPSLYFADCFTRYCGNFLKWILNAKAENFLHVNTIFTSSSSLSQKNLKTCLFQGHSLQTPQKIRQIMSMLQNINFEKNRFILFLANSNPPPENLAQPRA